ncbi:IgGFc-binding protein-like isoform X2 [Crassostrea angulata]|uniref:IgGFc-binding protein-like isoform X2 n=1 Tax=Magallana angulata TaxID=2784310 RepID=UPI0022B10A95|nr:IgGFc-binding protein-like isoform X2 [Crassostrea angulata]
MVWETVESNKDSNQIKVSKRANQDRESKQRTCICCLLILITLLVSALYVALLIIFRKHSCAMLTTTNNEVNLSLQTQTTHNEVNLSLQTQTTHIPISAQQRTVGSRGKSFVVLFMKYGYDATKSIYVTSENGVQINITTSPRLEASLKSITEKHMNIPSSQRIIIPQAMELQSFRVEYKAILIETSNDVFVISHDDGDRSVGSTTHIPLHKLSTKYIVITSIPIINSTSQLAVSAIKDNTLISIRFKMKQNLSLHIDGNRFYNGDVFKFSLNRFESYQIEHITDLTGTFVESSAKIAVFSGNDCNKLENFGGCDHLIEQLPPTDSVDKIYLVPPNSDDRQTVIRIIAIENANISYMIGEVTQTRYLRKLDYFNTLITSNETCYIKSEAPILVTAFGLHSKISKLGDPTMTIVPGINQYLNYYKIVVPSGYDHNYVSIMMKYSSKYFFRINGTVINTSDIVFEENLSVGNATYNVRSIRVEEGELRASTVNGERFGLMFAGVTYYEAYGFSGNSMLP